jgi:pimeloyl-ACP methyl ester carboxylesterase
MALELQQDRFTTVDGVLARYWAAGDKGPEVVLIHGLGGFIENWSKNILALASHHRVYALDLPGFGQTDKTPLIKDLTMLTRFIHDFMAEQNIPKASLVGHSLGGGLALQFTLDYPEKVEKLVLADNAGMGREVLADFRLCSLPVLPGLFVRQSRKDITALWQKIVYDKVNITPELVDLSYRYAHLPGAQKALLSALCAGIDLRGQKSGLTGRLLSRLNALKAPALVVWGRNDRIIPVSHAQIAVKKIPGARLEIFDNCGHMPMFEHPEKFNRLVLDFLAEPSLKEGPHEK